jgi:hypothetical protein
MKISIHQEGDSILVQWSTDEENGAFMVSETSDRLSRGEAGFKPSPILAPGGIPYRKAAGEPRPLWMTYGFRIHTSEGFGA